jgi:hypothetical protein
MARASVKLMRGSSYNGRGYRFGKSETKIISDDADIAYFKGNSRFRVTMMEGAPTPTPAKSKAEVKAPAGTEPEDNSADGGDGPLPWTKAMKKADLLAAAENRGIAVTPEDKVATIVQLLTEWDEEHDSE